MGEPIEFKVKRDVREELRSKLEAAPVEHAEALLSAYELLQEAHDHGVLDTLRGAIGAGESIVGKASKFANTEEGIRTLRNLLALIRIAGEVDPSILHSATKALREMQRRDGLSKAEPPSLWEIFRKLGSRDSRRTLAMLSDFSEALGRSQSVFHK